MSCEKFAESRMSSLVGLLLSWDVVLLANLKSRGEQANLSFILQVNYMACAERHHYKLIIYHSQLPPFLIYLPHHFCAFKNTMELVCQQFEYKYHFWSENYIYRMPSTLYKKLEFQELLDRHHQLQGELTEIQARIDEKQSEYLSGAWGDGNLMVGWHRLEPLPCKRSLDICPKDKKFSLSSVFSKASLQLGSLQNRRLAVFERSKFQKKKKSKKGKVRSKICKKRRIKRKKK